MLLLRTRSDIRALPQRAAKCPVEMSDDDTRLAGLRLIHFSRRHNTFRPRQAAHYKTIQPYAMVSRYKRLVSNE